MKTGALFMIIIPAMEKGMYAGQNKKAANCCCGTAEDLAHTHKVARAITAKRGRE